MSEKTEEPTDKKRRDARAEGRVAKSVDLTSLVQLSVLFTCLAMDARVIFDGFVALINVTLDSLNLPLDEAWAHISVVIGKALWRIVVPMSAALLVATAFALLMQTGIVLAPKALMPSMSRLSPLSNAKQIFSLKSVFEFCKSVTKVIVLTVIFYVMTRRYLNSFQFLPLCGLECGLVVTAKLVLWMGVALILFYVLAGVADFAFQKHTLHKEMMMSKEEVEKEYKESEGNPEMKQERRRTHQEIQSGSLADNVRRSTVVVRNPTHVAVCLYYREGETPLPQVIEKGVDRMALHIVALAEAAGIPVVENIHVARTLEAGTDCGGYIPAALFGPVAGILRIVSDLTDAGEEGVR